MKILANSSDTLVREDQLASSPSSFEVACSSNIKRFFDLVVAVIGLTISSPILFFAFIAIPLQSRGGPIFVQKRVGRNGKIFNIYKLRTMYSNTDHDGFKTTKDDRRLTPLGIILRVTNIDELPQLINIIKGDMSLIGPRPLSVDETKYIARSLNLSSGYPGFYPVARPGLVGLEQINRTRDLTYLERFKYNHEYERNWTLSVDLAIFARSLLICRQVCLAAAASGLLLGVGCFLLIFRSF